ncbi:MAG: hypothetical protein PVH19_14020, partial [Planctomycetia bacterium]
MKRLSFVLIAGLVLAMLCVNSAVAQTTGHIMVAPMPLSPGAGPQPPRNMTQYMKAATAAQKGGKTSTSEEEGEEGSEEDKKAQRKAEHLEKIEQLTFDRRPSAILKAWCGLAAEEEAVKAQKEKEAEEKAKKEQAEKEAKEKAAQEKTAKEKEAKEKEAAKDKKDPDKKDPDAKDPDKKDPDAKDPAADKSDKKVKEGEEKKEGEEEKKEEEEEKDPFDEEIKVFSRNVTLGKWDEVKKYLARIDKEEGEALYKKLLSCLQGSGNSAYLSAMAQGQGEEPVITFDDLFALADAVPFDLGEDEEREEETLDSLANLVHLAIGQGHVIEELIHRLKLDVEKPKDSIFTRRQAAKLLCKSDNAIHLAEFLPDIEVAKTNKDHEALNLLSQYQLAVYAKDEKMV